MLFFSLFLLLTRISLIPFAGGLKIEFTNDDTMLRAQHRNRDWR